MGKMVYLMGKSSTGKDTIYRELLKSSSLQLKKIVPYTTRPMRAGEKEGREYFFTDVENENYLIIGTLESYIKTAGYFGKEKVIPVLLEVDDGVRLQRALDRERRQETPKYEELCRRYLSDAEDFSEEKIREAGVTKQFSNENLEHCLAEIEEYISG